MSTIEKIQEKLKTATPAQLRKVLSFVESLESQARNDPKGSARTWDDMMGILKDSKIFEGDPVEIQRKMRSEWD